MSTYDETCESVGWEYLWDILAKDCTVDFRPLVRYFVSKYNDKSDILLSSFINWYYFEEQYNRPEEFRLNEHDYDSIINISKKTSSVLIDEVNTLSATVEIKNTKFTKFLTWLSNNEEYHNKWKVEEEKQKVLNLDIKND